MENFEEKACLCALNRIFGFEPKLALALLEHLSGAREVFRLSQKDLEEITGPYFKYKGRICSRAADEAAEELHRLSSLGISFCGWTEEAYPEILKECEDPPIGLYVRSTTPMEKLWGQGIAVVGTRDISPYGREWCRKIVGGLARCTEKPVIVSGLAMGTDIEAHRMAIECGLPTIGVMATGPDSIYPWRHRDFAERMVHTPGCALITDYPPGTAPLAVHFLRRNRIIAGLSRATILVESKIRGGGMMTCRLAFSYNRDVYALPGRIDDVRSLGCNDLIRRKTAEPITSVEELISSLGLKGMRAGKAQSPDDTIERTYSDMMSPEELKKLNSILSYIRKHRGTTLEETACGTGIDIAAAARIASLLEIDGFITIDLLQRCSINYKNV